MRHRLYVHLVWTTRERERLIDLEVATFLCRFLRSMARKERALKGASSAVAAQEGLGKLGRLYWAKRYSAQSVSAQALDRVRAYLRHQPIHHSEEAITGWEGDAPEFDKACIT